MDNLFKVITFIFFMWMIQGVLTYFQIKHFNNVLHDMKDEGKVLLGQKKGKLSFGSIIILAIDEKNKIINAKEMKGITVFSRFKIRDEFINKHIEELKEDIPKIKDKVTRKALELALSKNILS
ncbi:transcriptional regulator GutM [Anaerosalibacter bizertensis]|uniref:Transcriptional regulator GutM n=1 Tax=Anaerosalibacter bizertensis TaxID=932217 RepID=A0A9Q4FMF7_9FIRM|nr:transcriptional regulator GutM [Anaerosalibacter bizertensis]MBU5293670.1 transcriptional regulator GutM [Anaerosalibacter bizertensis]MCG4565674.1 transcriptional regulator GutM [Anaerosalibacter bizertensis]